MSEWHATFDPKKKHQHTNMRNIQHKCFACTTRLTNERNGNKKFREILTGDKLGSCNYTTWILTLNWNADINLSCFIFEKYIFRFYLATRVEAYFRKWTSHAPTPSSSDVNAQWGQSLSGSMFNTQPEHKSIVMKAHFVALFHGLWSSFRVIIKFYGE